MVLPGSPVANDSNMTDWDVQPLDEVARVLGHPASMLRQHGPAFEKLLHTKNFLDEDDMLTVLAVFEDWLNSAAPELVGDCKCGNPTNSDIDHAPHGSNNFCAAKPVEDIDTPCWDCKGSGCPKCSDTDACEFAWDGGFSCALTRGHEDEDPWHEDAHGVRYHDDEQPPAAPSTVDTEIPDSETDHKRCSNGICVYGCPGCVAEKTPPVESSTLDASISERIGLVLHDRARDAWGWDAEDIDTLQEAFATADLVVAAVPELAENAELRARVTELHKQHGRSSATIGALRGDNARYLLRLIDTNTRIGELEDALITIPANAEYQMSQTIAHASHGGPMLAGKRVVDLLRAWKGNKK